MAAGEQGSGWGRGDGGDVPELAGFRESIHCRADPQHVRRSDKCLHREMGCLGKCRNDGGENCTT